jgi:hypothetical protein
MTWSAADADKLRAEAAAAARALPGVVVQDAHGHTGFLLRGKRFAWFLVDHHGDGKVALWIKAPHGEQQTLVAKDAARYFVPPYVGPAGWVGIDLVAKRPDWPEITSLLEQAWRMSATKAAVRAFDAR